MKIRENINRAQAQSNLLQNKITIIAVTKKHPFLSIKSALENGINNIGENRVQETENKLKNNLKPEKINIHFIGNLQKNKAKKAVLLYDCIQTVDSIKLAQKINIEAEKLNKKQDIFLQINIGDKKEKHGFFTKDIIKAAVEIKSYNFVSIKGIMIIPPLTKDKKKYLHYFKAAKKIQTEVQYIIPECKNLSMGMSDDYIDAIKEGATHIRIGTALFGERQK